MGVDETFGLIHSVATTPANISDIAVADQLLHGEEKTVWGDAGYTGIEKREEHKDRSVNWEVAIRAGRRAQLVENSLLDEVERTKASIRAKEETFPVITRGNWQVMVMYEPDSDFIESRLPEGVKAVSDPAVAVVWILHARCTMLGGPHAECCIGTIVEFEGREYLYPLVVYMNPSLEEFFAAGREVWSQQKKKGVSQIIKPEGSGIVTGVLDRAGSRLMEFSVGPLEREAKAEGIGFFPVLSLRVIPHPEKPEPQRVELIQTEYEITPRIASDGHFEYWSGPGQIAFPVPSERDPLYRLKPLRMLHGYYGCIEGIVSPHGKIVKQIIP